MGNQHSCCIQKGVKHNEKDAYKFSGGSPQKLYMSSNQSYSNLQHISEREPEDNVADPSNNPTANTLFLTRSKSEIHKNNRLKRRSQYYEHTNHMVDLGPFMRKYSSCSTIFIDDSTVSQPNLKNTVKAVALAIYFHIRNRNRTNNFSDLDIFDECLHPLTREPVPEDYYRRDPEHKTIYRFVRTLFNAAQLTAECAIVTLVYLERLLTNAEVELAPSYWKRIILGAILLASKVWDDQAVWNVDYCQILKDMTIEDMNELERQYLEILQFNINVPSSVYAKYYFDLRALADAHDLSFPLETLSKERALKLEAMSNLCEDRIKKSGVKRSSSLDGFSSPANNTKAIIS